MARASRLLVVGDSHSVTLASYLKPLAEADGWVFHNYGNVGKSTRWFSQQTILDDLVRQFRPDVTVVVLGTNDADPDDKASVNAVYQKLKSSKVVWVGPPTFPKDAEFDRTMARRAATIASQPGIQFIDARRLTSDLDAYRPGNGVHFTYKGYEIWAQRIYPLIGKSVKTDWKKWVGVLSLVGVAVLGIVWIGRR